MHQSKHLDKIDLSYFFLLLYFRLSWIRNLGGLLGLCIGGSFISVVELVGYLFSAVSRKFGSPGSDLPQMK